MRCLLALFLTMLVSCNTFKKDGDNNKKNQNLLLGAIALSQPQPKEFNLNFKAVMGGHELECGSHTYTMPGTQVVQVQDFRFFVQDIQFVKSDGSKVPFIFSNVDKYQAREGENQVALLDFSKVNQGACTNTSDDDTTNTAVKGTAIAGVYKRVELTIGVPQALNHQDPTQKASTHPLRAGTGMTWNWQAGYKFAKVEFSISTSSTSILRLHLGSTNCTGTAPNVTCANPYRASLVLEPNGGFDTAKDTIVFDAEELFKGNGGVPTSAYSTGVSLSCMPIGNGSGTGGTPETCGPILKNLGLKPGTQAGFTSTLVTETGVGTVDETTRQPILKVLREVNLEHQH